jgi:hypothetical protein
MIRIRHNIYFKSIAVILSFLFLFQGSSTLFSQTTGNIREQIEDSKNELKEGLLKSALIRLLRLVHLIENRKNTIRAQVYMLLGICYEKDKKVKEAEEAYKKALNFTKNKKMTFNKNLVKGLKIYTKYFGPGKEIKEEQNVIVKEKKKKKKFPWLLVAGAVVVTVAVILLLKKKKYTLTVTQGEGVEGNPANGTYRYKKGKTVNYSYSLQSGYTDLVVTVDGQEVASSGTIKMDGDHTLSATATKTYTLNVTKGEGVEGTPDSGSFTYKVGETVDYSYSLHSGYIDLVVTLDGNPVESSGTITMDRSHELIALSTRQFTLTVSRGVGVNGTPGSGTYLYKSGEKVNYNYSLRSGYTDLVVTLDGKSIESSGTITMDRDHELTATSARTYTLTVSRGIGVNGTPGSGNYLYRSGEKVNYNYNLQSSYSILEVKLDGNAVASNGTITMNRNHNLTASAYRSGRIRVISSPSGANIWIDNHLQGYTTPATIYNIRPGLYQVIVRKAGYASNERNIHVNSGQQTNVDFTLTNIEYGTHLNVNGSAVRGYVDGTSGVDWFWFYIRDTGTYTIDTYPYGDNDVGDNYMHLYGIDNRTNEIERDDDHGTGRYARISRHLEPGNYFVKMRGYSNYYSGYFYIKVFSGSTASNNDEQNTPNFKKVIDLK